MILVSLFAFVVLILAGCFYNGLREEFTMSAGKALAYSALATLASLAGTVAILGGLFWLFASMMA